MTGGRYPAQTDDILTKPRPKLHQSLAASSALEEEGPLFNFARKVNLPATEALAVFGLGKLLQDGCGGLVCWSALLATGA